MLRDKLALIVLSICTIIWINWILHLIFPLVKHFFLYFLSILIFVIFLTICFINTQIITFFIDSSHEINNITWPSFNKIRQLTFNITMFCIIVSSILGIYDFIFFHSVELIHNKFLL